MDWRKYGGRPTPGGDSQDDAEGASESEFQKYYMWKQGFEKRAGRSYKWPVMSLLLQTTIVKVVLGKREPDLKFIEVVL